MLILVIIAFGMVVGWLAQLALGRRGHQVNWGLALVAGLAGSFLGGLFFSLLLGDGLDLRPSGMIGSFLGALVITAAFSWYTDRQAAAAKAAAKASAKPHAKSHAKPSSKSKRTRR